MTDTGKPNFEGHQPRECGEHRTVGSHRAWCHDCQEWCYPSSPCARCEVPALRTRLEAAGGINEKLATRVMTLTAAGDELADIVAMMQFEDCDCRLCKRFDAALTAWRAALSAGVGAESEKKR